MPTEPAGRPTLPEVRVAAPADLDAATLYALLRLRVDVFVVEQECPYPELDGRDLEPGTRHLWTGEGPAVSAYLRLLDDPGGDVRIGRVCTAPAHRGRGLADLLVRTAVRLAADHPVVLDAQAHLEHWYAGRGFTRAGQPFVEDGIPHVPMRRPAGGHADP